MPSLRERITELFPGRQAVRRLNSATEALLSVYQRRNLLGADSIKEYDTQTMDSMLRHLNDLELSNSLNDSGMPDEDERLKSVNEARYLYHYDVQARHGVRLWTNYGLGTDPQIIVKDKKDEDENEAPEEGVMGTEIPSQIAQAVDVPKKASELDSAAKVWAECWTARRNAPLFKQRRLGRMSDKLMVDGELFFAAFYSTAESDKMAELIASDVGIDIVPKGASTIRLIDTTQITEFVSDPNDVETVCYYKRDWYDNDTRSQRTVYYEAWDAHKSGATRRVKLPDGAKVEKNCYVKHAEHNTIGMRGWPITSTNAPWLRAYKKFMQDRVTVAASKAMFVRKFTTEGGSRAVDAVRNFFSSSYQSNLDTERNPAAVAGSSLVTNKAVDMQDLPLNTGAGDAQTDGTAIVAQAALGFGAFAHYFGHGEAFRLATSTSMEAPMLRVWSAYQMWWQGVFTDLVGMAVGIWEEVNKKDLPEYVVSVQIDPLVDVDVSKFVAAMIPAYQVGLVPELEAMLLMLQAFGVEHAQEVVDKNAGKGKVPPMPAAMAPGTKVPTPAPADPNVPPVPEPVPQMEIARELRAIGELARQMLNPNTTEELRQEAARALSLLADEPK